MQKNKETTVHTNMEGNYRLYTNKIFRKTNKKLGKQTKKRERNLENLLTNSKDLQY